MDEDKIWNFQMTPYNQQAVYNKHIYDPRGASQDTYMPHWFAKLLTPLHHKDGSKQYYLDEFVKQWNERIGLEKMKRRMAADPDKRPYKMF